MTVPPKLDMSTPIEVRRQRAARQRVSSARSGQHARILPIAPKAAVLIVVSGQALRPAALERTHEARCNCSKGEPMRISEYPVMAVLLGAAVLATDARAQQKPSELRQQMVGTWSLSEQWVEQDGKKVQRFGANPKGIAIYDGNGRFATILLRADLPKFASNNAMTGTADENKAIVQGSNATYGSWSINEAGRVADFTDRRKHLSRLGWANSEANPHHRGRRDEDVRSRSPDRRHSLRDLEAGQVRAALGSAVRC